jgi:hypothetical protein
MPIIVCGFISTRVDKIITISHIVTMKDEKEYLKPNNNALIKWWIPFGLLQLQCRWIKNLVAYSCGNESYCFQEPSTEEKQIPLNYINIING